MNELSTKQPTTQTRTARVGIAVPEEYLLIEKLRRVAAAPTDARCTLAVVRGALLAAKQAVRVLVSPNTQCLRYIAALTQLRDALELQYEEHLAVDVQHQTDKSLAGFPAWRLLNAIGQTQADSNGALACICGVHLLAGLAEDTQLSQSFCDHLRRDQALTSIADADIKFLVDAISDDRMPLWLPRHRKDWWIFLRWFESSTDDRMPQRAFDDVVRGQLISSSMYPLRGQRQGVLTDRALSVLQLRETTAPVVRSPFNCLLEQQVVLWLTIFGGVSFEHIGKLPIYRGTSSLLSLDIGQGCLLRSLSVLAPEQPRCMSNDSRPASMSFRLPLPSNLHEHLKTLLSANPHAKSIGDLISALHRISTTDPIFPSLASLRPSWARLSNSVGTFLRQQGMDSLLAAMLTADFGHTAKSKLHYAHVEDLEIHDSAASAYRLLGFDKPVNFADAQIGFGSPIVPTQDSLIKAARFIHDQVDQSRPGRNAKDLGALLNFHHQYSLAVSFWVSFSLALRNTRHIPLPTDSLIILTEKSISARKGGLPAIAPPSLKRQVALYQAHCHALARRMPNYQTSSFITWLRAGDVHDIRTCSDKLQQQEVSSTDVTNWVHKAVDLPPDFGRKFLENELRRCGVPTRDIDRVLRHEVSGQASMCSSSADSIHAWSCRTSALIQSVLTEYLGDPIVGLRGERA